MLSYFHGGFCYKHEYHANDRQLYNLQLINNLDVCEKLEEILQRREASEDGLIGCCSMFIEIIQIMFADNGADLCGSGGYIR